MKKSFHNFITYAFIFAVSNVWGQDVKHIRYLFDGFKEEFPKMKLSNTQSDYWRGKYKLSQQADTTSESTDEWSFIDINKDTIPDIVSVSELGLPSLYFYIGTQDSLKRIFEKWESNLSDIKYSGKNIEIVIQSAGMVDPYFEESIYRFTNDTLILIESRELRVCSFKPQVFYKTFKNIQTIKDTISLRESPRIETGKCSPEDTGYSLGENIISKYLLNSKGRVWAESHDVGGDKWYFVELLTQDKHDIKQYKIGWMNAEEAEEVK
jgi:hypothetical protein